MMATKRVYIGIGSNVGNREENCRVALTEIRELPGCIIAAASEWYLTRPVGVEDQEWYVNGVVALDTSDSARSLLGKLRAIEEKMGRVRKVRWEPRVIDLDILLFGDQIINAQDLTVPHPRMHERRFVLLPLTRLAPRLVHPALGSTVAELLEDLPEDGQEVLALKDR